MNKLNSLILVLTVLTSTFLSSCKKDDDNEPSPSKTELLTAGDWTGDAIYAHGMPITEEFFGDDFKSFKIKYSKDGTYTMYDEGEEMSSGKWELSKDEKHIIQDKDTEDEYHLLIKKLTSKEFHFETEEVMDDDVKAMVEYRFKR